MSWSFYKSGDAAEVKAEAHKYLGSFKCAEPEETIKGQVLSIIEHSLAAFPEGQHVNIEAFGSQYSATPEGTAINSLTVRINPVAKPAE